MRLASSAVHELRQSNAEHRAIQLIRDPLAGESAWLPDLQTLEIQSYAVTTAVLVKQVTDALEITDLRIPDAWKL